MMEIIVVLAIIGVFFGFVASRFSRRKSDERLPFVDKINLLIGQGTRRAQELQTYHRLVFDFQNNRVFLEKASQAGPMKPSVSTPFGKVTGFVGDTIQIPSSLVFNKLIIEGKDEMAETASKALQTYVFIDPDGNMQEVKLGLGWTQNGVSSLQFILNPFTRQFVLDEKTGH